jgi:membrane associated rhomboid family serine protease
MQWREAPGTYIISALTLAVSALVILTGQLPLAAIVAGFVPLGWSGVVALPAGHPAMLPGWMTPLTATLIHAGWAHVALNLVMLVYCGRQAERAVGTAGIGILYLVGAFAAAAGQWALSPGSAVPMIGASGAISAIVAAYALLYGQRQAKRIGPIPAGVVHVAWLATAWVGIQALTGFAGLGAAPIAVGAHVGGFIAGLVLTRPLLMWRWRGA